MIYKDNNNNIYLDNAHNDLMPCNKNNHSLVEYIIITIT